MLQRASGDRIDSLGSAPEQADTLGAAAWPLVGYFDWGAPPGSEVKFTGLAQNLGQLED
jgi:hypothetical protein